MPDSCLITSAKLGQFVKVMPHCSLSTEIKKQDNPQRTKSRCEKSKRDNSLTSHHKQQKDRYYPMSCLRRPHTESVGTSVFVLQNRLQSGFKRRPRPAEPKVPRYVNRIRLFLKLTQVISTKHLFKWTLLELPSFDRFLNTSQTSRTTGNHWTHHSTFSH